jgi:hypothetical protein
MGFVHDGPLQSAVRIHRADMDESPDPRSSGRTRGDTAQQDAAQLGIGAHNVEDRVHPAAAAAALSVTQVRRTSSAAGCKLRPSQSLQRTSYHPKWGAVLRQQGRQSLPTRPSPRKWHISALLLQVGNLQIHTTVKGLGYKCGATG